MKSLLVNLVSRIFILSAVALALPACRSDAQAVCDYKCDCEGCSNAAIDDCYYHADDDEVSADRRGCVDYYDELQACEYDTGVCKGSDWETKCGVERDRYKNCMK